MFDTNSTIEIGLRHTSGKIQIQLRWPNDEEWANHHKRRKILLKQLGRGISETEIDSTEADLKLYEAIKLDGAPPLSAGEAARVVEIISQCDVMGVDLGADEAEVELQILTGRVKHFLKIPTMDQVRELQRSTRLISLPYNRQEVRTNLEASARLWGTAGGRAEGYTNGVPNIHKDIAIRAVINAVEQEATSKYDESSF